MKITIAKTKAKIKAVIGFKACKNIDKITIKINEKINKIFE